MTPDLFDYAVAGLLVTAFVQFIKTKFPLHALLILAGVSFLGAAGYVLLQGFGLWEQLLPVALTVMATANLIYNVLKTAYGALGGDDTQAQ